MYRNGRLAIRLEGCPIDFLRTCERYSWNVFRWSNLCMQVQNYLPSLWTVICVLYVSCRCQKSVSKISVTVCFFSASCVRYENLPAHPPSLYFSPWGEALSSIYYQKVERRTQVHIGIRDGIVNIDISRTRLSPVVRITTTQHQTEARNLTFRRQQPCAKIRKLYKHKHGKHVKEQKISTASRLFVWATYRSRVLWQPSSLKPPIAPFRPHPHTPAPQTTPLPLRREANPGSHWHSRRHC